MQDGAEYTQVYTFMQYIQKIDGNIQKTFIIKV